MGARIGIDLGGTKIEAIALEGAREVFRKRVATPRGDYDATVQAVADLVEEAGAGSVGVGIPGNLSRVTGLVKRQREEKNDVPDSELPGPAENLHRSHAVF